MSHSKLVLVVAMIFGTASPSRAALLPGFGEVSGSVVVPKGVVIPVYLRNPEKNMGYEVFAVNGSYRAIDLFPGHYEITVRKNGFDMAPVRADVAAGGHVIANLTPKSVPVVPTYVLGTTYRDTTPTPFDKIYPPGPGLDIARRTCLVCHTVNFLPDKQLDREGWNSLIDEMLGRPAFIGNLEGPTTFDPARLPPKDRETLLDYLAKNFGPDSSPRSVLQGPEPEDAEALSKAMFVEYIWPSTKERPHRWTQEVHFDSKGNVLIAERSKPSGIIKLDPRTGDAQFFWGPKSMPDPDSMPHGLTVDADDTVWWTGANVFVGHLDPATGLTDQYVIPQLGMSGDTDAFTSTGNLWISMMLSDKLAYWDRKTNKVSYWEKDAPYGRPYGLIVDHRDQPWFIEYHTGHVTTFDLETQKFKRYPIQTQPAQMRRLGVDHKNYIWYGVYGCICKRGKLGRLDPKTGKTIEYEIPLDYADPYDVQADENDNIWMPMDNHIVKFDQVTKKFTIYPMPMRTDSPKISITRENAVWFEPRSAGNTMEYGAGAVVLYPDKNKITELAAYYSPRSAENNIAKYKGPMTKVIGTVYETKDGPRNPGTAPVPIKGPPNDWASRDWTKGPSKSNRYYTGD